MSESPVPQPGDNLRRVLERIRAARIRRGDDAASAYERAYEKGFEGELRFGTALNEAAKERGGCWVLHGLVVPGAKRDIDHLVVGPAGVTVIDAKTWEGQVWVGRIGLGHGPHVTAKPIEGMSRQINRVHSVLAKAGRDDVPVEGLVCMVNDNEGIPASGFAEVSGVKVGRPAAVMERALRSGPLDVVTVERMQRVLVENFEIRGGASAPTDRPKPRRRPQRHARMLRLSRRLALAVLAATIALAALAAGIALIDTGVESSAKHLRTFSRDDLRAQRGELRAIAARRAHGKVRGPKIRTSGSYFVLTYRRGRHCRVLITVLRAAPVLNGGSRSVATTGCSRRSE